MWKKSLFSLLLAGGLVSCTVKEDRAGCPCRLSVLIEDGRQEKAPVTYAVGGADPVLEERFSAGALLRADDCEIPKGLWDSYAYSGLSAGRLEGTVARIPAGMPSDPLYAGAAPLDATGEEATSRIGLHKQYAAVTLDLREYLPTAEGLQLFASGNVCGLDLARLAPVEGTFACALEPVEDRVFRFLAPRQRDDSLELQVWTGGELDHTLPLGKAMAAAGYDWTAPDLADITLALTLISLDFGVEVVGWDEIAVE
ncbi:MAG: hypothetical protein J6Y27_04360 [Bacteroidales bacterium]|nr:hypothetical protein [Bacteroidales bacterium]